MTVRSVLLYRDKVIDLLHEFKYNSKIYVTDFISGEIIKNFPADISGFDVVVPVPLHINRLRDRGYNQTVLISRVLSRKFCKFLDLYSLKKIRDTDPQVQMSSFYSRAKNVKNSFRVDKNAQFLGKRILLLDDVYTSGSTVKECSRKLIEAGAKRVFALTLARAG
ncbi:MAG: hypothetical protein GTN59_15125 [Candidatus Dadabacteria bacterium]|nr:hypothetical protein [Candidatus Dadabacteria bacterium]